MHSVLPAPEYQPTLQFSQVVDLGWHFKFSDFRGASLISANERERLIHYEKLVTADL